VLGTVRTAIGKFGGSLAAMTAVELAAVAGREAIRRSGLDGSAVDEVIMANARQAGVGPNPGRAVASAIGLPESVPGATINMACGSGLKALVMAWQAIALGQADAVLALGAEAMSQIPYLLTGARWGYRLGHGEVTDALHKDGFICALTNQHMGDTAENLALRYGITRAESDAYAAESQRRAAAAAAAGRFASQIAPVFLPQRKGQPKAFDLDEHPRPDSTLAALAGLKPVFRPEGIVTAGSASGIADGAAAALVVAREFADAHGLRPELRLRDWAAAGVDPNVMGIGPVPSTNRALANSGLSIGDLDLVEINEAFAPQVIACQRELGYDPARANPDGGAIALGHPIGMTGLRLIVALAHGLPRAGGELGLATLCINGGMGLSVIVERAG
jgi:acetyl-CoA C-acetyltransferase